jgi:hypothetical protein
VLLLFLPLEVSPFELALLLAASLEVLSVGVSFAAVEVSDSGLGPPAEVVSLEVEGAWPADREPVTQQKLSMRVKESKEQKLRAHR